MGFKEKNDTHWPLPTLQASSVKHAAVRCASHWLKPAAVGTRGRSMCRWRVEVPWKNMHHYPTVFAGWSQKDHPILTQIDISDISYNSWLSSMKIPHFSWLRPNISPWSRIPYCIYMYIYISWVHPHYVCTMPTISQWLVKPLLQPNCSISGKLPHYIRSLQNLISKFQPNFPLI